MGVCKASGFRLYRDHGEKKLTFRPRPQQYGPISTGFKACANAHRFIGWMQLTHATYLGLTRAHGFVFLKLQPRPRFSTYSQNTRSPTTDPQPCFSWLILKGEADPSVNGLPPVISVTRLSKSISKLKGGGDRVQIDPFANHFLMEMLTQSCQIDSQTFV